MNNLSEILRTCNIDRSWTLFIDRDGVINQKRDGDYVKKWDEFSFIPGVLERLPVLSNFFQTLVIVTNQRGIGRGLMSEADLTQIHKSMLEEINEAGGRIDKIYHCPNLAEDDPNKCRKPEIGMALQAKSDFPHIRFEQSIMIGDALSDMQFGRNAGMKTVWVSEKEMEQSKAHLIDGQVANLETFCQWLLEDKIRPTS